MNPPMSIDASVIAWGAAAGNLIITAFLVGVVYGRLTSKIAANSKDIVEVKVAIEAVNKKITSPEGEPLLLSYKAHDHLCGRTNELLAKEIGHMAGVLAAHSEAVKSCGDQVSSLTVAVAVLEEKVGV